MTFVYPILLAGLAAVAIPIVLHLLRHQQPRQLLFPAFRFLVPNQRTNRRKLRLRHWLLLAMRMLLLAGICLALSRPSVFSERLNLVGEQPAAVVLIFDTRASMEYQSGGKSSLDVAKTLALEVLDDLPQGSQVAVLDSAQPEASWATTPVLAREQIEALKVQPANAPLTSRLGQAYRLLGDLTLAGDGGVDAMPRFLYVFSNRTTSSWDATRQTELETLRDASTQQVSASLIDVGPEKPVDMAVIVQEPPGKVLGPRERLTLKALVRAVGAACDTELLCKIDKESAPERKLVQLQAGQSQVVIFDRDHHKPGWHQAELRLATSDSFPANDAIYLTYEVQGGRPVLILVDDKRDAFLLNEALTSLGSFQPEILGVGEALNLTREQWSRYRAVCLLNVARPSAPLWRSLEKYVAQGGGLAIMPGGENTQIAAYEPNLIMPAALKGIVSADTPAGSTWSEASYQHPVLMRFRDWRIQNNLFRNDPPAAFKYWAVEPSASNGSIIVRYHDQKNRPALLEPKLDPRLMKGRALLFTTPMDLGHLEYGSGKTPWNNYMNQWFYLGLIKITMNYLAGDASERALNFRCGQPVPLSLPASSRRNSFLLRGPNLSPERSLLRRQDAQGEIVVDQPLGPGNYVVESESGPVADAFSVNLSPEDSLWEKVPAAQIDALLGKGSVVQVVHGVTLRDLLQKQRNQPLELFPTLMILVLLLLVAENYLGNRFYRETQTTATASSREAA